MKHLVFCLALAAGFAPGLFSQNNIEFEKMNGPFGGGSRVLVGKPGFLYQVFGDNIIYRSSDDGATWAKMPQPPANIWYWPVSVGADGNLYCANNSTIFKSTDNAQTWQALAANPAFSIQTVFALPDGTILSGSSSQISRSMDNGQTWTTTQNLNAEGGFAYNPLTGDVFAWSEYVATGTTGKLLRSSDKGLTWATVLEDENCINLHMAFAPNGTVFVGGEDFLWKSTDNCATWTADDLSFEQSYREVHVAVSQTGRVFTFEWFRALYSDDNGTTWQPFNDYYHYQSSLSEFTVSPSGKIFAMREYGSTYVSSDNGANWAFSAQGIPFAQVGNIVHVDDSNILAMTNDGFWQSKNGGKDWTMATLLEGTDTYDLALVAADAATWFCYDGFDKLLKITNDGATQTALATPLSQYSFVGLWRPKTGNRLFLSTWDGLYTSDDEGQTWALKNPNSPNELVFMPDGSILSPDWTGLLKSTDDGENWSVLSQKYLPGLRLGENGSLYQSDYQSIFTSADGGLTWDSIPVDQNAFISFDNVAANNIGQVFALDTWDGRVLRSVDGGYSFNPVSAVNEDFTYLAKLSFDPAQRVFVATQSGGIYRSKAPTSQTKILSGTTFFDKNQNCDRDLPTDTTLTRRLVKATKGSQTVYGYVNAAGKYLLPMEPGDWTAEAIPPSNYWQSCAEAVNIPNSPTVGIVDSAAIGLKAVVDCPLASIEISAPFLRRCFESTMYAQFKNTGTAPAIDAKLTITLDPFLVFNSASLPVFSQNGQAFTFSLGNLDIGEVGSMTIKVTPDCVAPLGQLHCVSAHITPDVLCPQTFGGKVKTSATCSGDSLHLLISNIGQAAIAAPLNWSVTAQNWNNPGSWSSEENGQFQLAVGGTKSIAIAADGSKNYTFWAQQSPDFPFNVVSTTTVRGCGAGANLPLAIENEDDDGPFDDHFCQPNIGAYDPNDKQGFPTGLGDGGHIEREQRLEYLIRFQNTGSDTAYNISVRDTLPATLDPATLTLGPSSQLCRLQMMPDGSAMFLFEHIMLPDSNVNEADSHGFVQYSISQKPGNPIGTKIENRAGIYFDFNEPVLTNFTRHTVGIPQVSGTNGPVLVEKPAFRILPNPFSDAAELVLTQKAADGQEFLFEMHDLMGRKVRSEMFTGPRATVLRGSLPAGLYQFSVKTHDGGLVGSGTVSVQ